MGNHPEECTFCRIVKGDIEARIVYEDEQTLGLLDINPIARGHTLVIPKNHVTWFYEMDDDLLTDVFLAAKRVANRLRAAFDIKHVSLFTRGTRIPHVHVFVVPKHRGEPSLFDRVMDLHNFVQERQQEVFLTDAELDRIAEAIRES